MRRTFYKKGYYTVNGHEKICCQTRRFAKDTLTLLPSLAPQKVVSMVENGLFVCFRLQENYHNENFIGTHFVKIAIGGRTSFQKGRYPFLQ